MSNLIEVLEENYINENPQEAGIRNAYLIKLFHSMQGLQIAAEGVEGFPVDQMESLGGIRVPEYPTQHGNFNGKINHLIRDFFN